MGSTTPNYGFATDVVADDFIDPSHHNRVADTVDRALGGVLENLVTPGAHAGWEIQGTKRVSAGRGLAAACWCLTGAEQDILQLSDNAVNYVYGVPGESSGPAGSIAFVAQTAPPGPAGSILLGTIELDGAGAVVAVDNEASGVQRNCHQVLFGKLSGSGTVPGIPAGGTVEVTVGHAAGEEFLIPGDLRVNSEAVDLSWRVTQCHRGDGFVFEVTNEGAAAADFAYSWSREGLLREL